MSNFLESYHHFLFPFYLPPKPGATNAPIADYLAEEWKPAMRDDTMLRKDSPEQQILDYNEMSYFYPFARSAVHQGKSANPLAEYTHSLVCPESRYEIKVNRQDREHGDARTYPLHVTELRLKCYATGVNVLIISCLYDPREREPHMKPSDGIDVYYQDLTWINQFGRRLFTPFVPFQKVFNGVSIGRCPLVAERLHLKLNGSRQITYDQEAVCPEQPYMPNFIHELLWKSDRGLPSIQPVFDDRMFVHCLIRNDELSKGWTAWNKEKQDYAYRDWSDAKVTGGQKWYQLIHIDEDDPTCQHPGMARERIDERTYRRWIDWGTLYGITNYSFICVTGEWDGLFASVINPFQSMYLELLCIVLAQRASYMNFQSRVARTGERFLLNPNGNMDGVRQIEAIYRDFCYFDSTMEFTDITAQDQGIDLYRMLREQLFVERMKATLDGELDRLNEYAQRVNEAWERDFQREQLKHEEKERKFQHNISIIATIGVAMALVQLIFDLVK